MIKSLTFLLSMLSLVLVSLIFILKTDSSASARSYPLTSILDHTTMVIVPAVHLGQDGKMHDSFTPTALTARVGRQVMVTVYNYDTGMHAFAASGLHLNVMIRPAKRDGEPSITTFRFTATKPGVYRWYCTHPCDTEAHGWGMGRDGYMAGSVTVTSA